ncbi:GmrSD restriction endonuclease domain-containing protein [Streptoalloteichus hindustanus]|uniref:GmrSD restriction endonucleases N-terminal domain-containing protein n=1 Tax=Streptoalloteichus hindustanus TaxID=2017 RepID=A0A1M5LGY9_STRHI|nr:DUF262 domain-containing protein [Streptoalloteichus hindustanus]SHG63939.1 hypothetical protein SAMN05444320_11199 [Streptoalloteichus hindustanus]
MPVEKTERDVTTLVGQISGGEIRLPEIQRGYVWKPTQVARLVESLYRGYPTGSLLFWQTTETPQTREAATGTPQATAAVLPLYLLDGQQRLTSLHRVLTDHPDAQVVFNVETEAFQNQSATTAKDPRWIKVHEVLRPGAKQFPLIQRLHEAVPALDPDVVGERIGQLAAVRSRRFHMEILTDFPYEEVAQIFVRVNSGGQRLRTTDLSLATLSARWPGILGKLEDEADYWARRDYPDLDVTFLTRALTGAVLGRGLNAWSHGKLVAASDEALEQGWRTVQRGLRHLVPLLRENLGVDHSGLIPSHVALLPLIVFLGERPDEPLGADTTNAVLYWFLVATIRARYSGSTDTRLGQDIPATREPEPIKRLLANLGALDTRVEVTANDLQGRNYGSPYFFLSYLVARRANATDWWYGTSISANAEGSQKLEYHHIHPQSTLRNHPNGYGKGEINEMANLAFISARANRKISNRSPKLYFPELDPADLAAHFVPLQEELRDASAYREFLVARRTLLAETMTALLDRFRPSWVAPLGGSADPLAGRSLEFQLYRGQAQTDGSLVVTARTGTDEWSAALGLADLESALRAAESGLDSDVDIAGEIVPVRVDHEDVEILMGPFLVSGSMAEWKQTLDRERADALPWSKYPVIDPRPWRGERVRFPVANVD